MSNANHPTWESSPGQFEVDLKDHPGTPIVREIRPSAEKLNALFEGIEEFHVVEGREFCIEAKISLVGDKVRLEGGISGEMSYTCGRCLRPREVAIESELDYVLLPAETWAQEYEAEDEIELTEEDLDVSTYRDERVDLRPFVRETVLLDLPVYAYCPQGDAEDCDEAFDALVGQQALDDNNEASTDLRWAPLADLKAKMQNQDN